MSLPQEVIMSVAGGVFTLPSPQGYAQDGTPLATTFSYSSSDSGVATVSGAGIITATGVGTCTVTVTSVSGATFDIFVVVFDPTVVAYIL